MQSQRERERISRAEEGRWSERTGGRTSERARERVYRGVFVFAWVGAYIQRPGTSPPLSRDGEAIPFPLSVLLVSGSGLFFCDATQRNALIGTLGHESSGSVPTYLVRDRVGALLRRSLSRIPDSAIYSLGTYGSPFSALPR